MRKNRLMRLASVLLVLTLLTTSVIGGTFAKYVTTDSATDTARVAKWGIVASVSGDLFGNAYLKKDGNSGNTITAYATSNTSGANSVQSEETNKPKVVAPGTKNDTGLTLAVSGKAEVSSKVTIANAKKPTDSNADFANSDIYLAEGTYGVMAEYNGVVTSDNMTQFYHLKDGEYSVLEAVPTSDTDKVYELVDIATVTGNYYPLEWTVKAGTASTGTKVTNVAAVVTELEKTFKPSNNSLAKNPGESYTESVTVTWEWPFGAEGAPSGNDTKDTILGDLMAVQLATETDGDKKPIVVKETTAANTGAGTKAQYTAVTVANPENGIVYAKIGNTKVACLTAAFGVQLTVEQVD